jgi:phosphohistidine phosphatase SixA
VADESGAAEIELHLLRHAHAGQPEAWTGPDERRPLSSKGERQAERLGRFLASVAFRPDALISSPKVRAAQTAEIVGDALGIEVRLDERLGGPLDLVAIEAVLFDAGEPVRPVLVGHDPDFSDILGELCGASTPTMRKGALARVDVARPLRAGAGTLRWLVPPDLLQQRRGR